MSIYVVKKEKQKSKEWQLQEAVEKTAVLWTVQAQSSLHEKPTKASEVFSPLFLQGKPCAKQRKNPKEIL